MEEPQVTTIWEQYQKGKDYLSAKSYYGQLKKNYNFYTGNQWGEESKKLAGPMPIDNIIQPIVDYKVGVVSQNNMSMIFTSDNTSDDDLNELEGGINFKQVADETMELLNVSANKFIEKNNLETEMWNYNEDNCIDGIVSMYLYKDKDDEIAEEVNANNIFFSDENEPNIQNQEYIIITFRRPVEQVIAEARQNGLSENEIALIGKDNDTDEQIANPNEVDTEKGKVLCILKLYKKNTSIPIKEMQEITDELGNTKEEEVITGKENKTTVHMVKSTKNVIYVKETDLRLNLYPIAKMFWKRERNNARGRGEPHDKIKNQIEINKTLARRDLAITMTAYPKLVYLKEKISNPNALDKIGVGIAVQGQSVQEVKNAIDYLRPVQISPDAKQFSDELRQNTKDNASANDNALGNINAGTTSGRTVIAIRDASVVPINIHVTRLKKFYEDIANILFDFWQNTNPAGKRIVLKDKDDNGNEITKVKILNQELLKRLKVSTKVEVAPTDPYSLYAQETMWENLFVSGNIDFEEYVSGLPNNTRSNKSKLQELLIKRKEKEEEIRRIESDMKMEQQQVSQVSQEITTNDEIDNISNGIHYQQKQFLGGDEREV